MKLFKDYMFFETNAIDDINYIVSVICIYRIVFMLIFFGNSSSSFYFSNAWYFKF